MLEGLPGYNDVREAVCTLLDREAVRRDLRVKATGGTARTFANLGQVDLKRSAPGVPELYFSRDLVSAIEDVVGDRIAPLAYEPEQFVANRMEREGDTNGWHWDDYAYAVVWVFDAPSPGFGGSLQMVRGTRWDKCDPRVEEIAREGPVVERHPGRGTVYVLRADTTLHRVTPLARAARRDVLCFSYSGSSDRGRTITHETVELLYASNFA